MNRRKFLKSTLALAIMATLPAIASTPYLNEVEIHHALSESTFVPEYVVKFKGVGTYYKIFTTMTIEFVADVILIKDIPFEQDLIEYLKYYDSPIPDATKLNDVIMMYVNRLPNKINFPDHARIPFVGNS